MKKKNLLAVFTMLVCAVQAQASVESKIDRAVYAFEDLMAADETSIPTDLLKSAKCIVSMKIYQGGFIFGGKGGAGVASCRGQDGTWSAPLFIDLGGGTIGFQIGVEKVDLTLVFTNKDAPLSLLQDNFTLSGNAGLTAGPEGRNLSAGTNYSLDDKIYAYSRSQGLYAGVSVEGSYLFLDKDDNAAAYGRKRAREILGMSGSSAPAVVRDFPGVLEKYSR